MQVYNMQDKYIVNVKCVFCGSNSFELPYEGYQPELHEMIKCSNCGNANYFEAARKVAIQKTVEVIEEDVHKEIVKMFKKSGFKVK